MCVCVFKCWLTLRHHSKGPDQELKRNFDPAEIGPLGRVSSGQFRVIYQSTNQPEPSGAPAGRLPSWVYFSHSEVVFPGCLRLVVDVVDVAQVVTTSDLKRFLCLLVSCVSHLQDQCQMRQFNCATMRLTLVTE